MKIEYNAANNLIARYTHGPGIDEPLIMERGGQSYFYHADGLGSITVLTDLGKNVVQSYVYNAFGNIVEKTGSLINPYTYTGREYDSESGLYFYRARYYDPKIGRFLQEDPIGFLGGMNFYTYVGNNPVNWVDPWGWRDEKSWDEMTSEEAIKWEKEHGNIKSVPLSEDPVFLVLLIGQNVGKGGLYRPDGPGHGLGPHDHIGPWKTGPEVPNWGRQVWKGWIDWIKQGGGWKWPWN